MADHPIQGLMQTALENLKQMIDVNTIIGDAVETPDGSIILPISKVGFGFAAGGSEFELDGQSGPNGKPDLPFGGGAGGGVSISPIGFLVVGNGQIRMLSSETPNQLFDRLIDLAPQVVEKIQSMNGKNNESNQQQQQDPQTTPSNLYTQC